MVYSKELLIKIFPKWESQIRQGDFKVRVDEKEVTHIEWTNTNIFAPTQSDITRAVKGIATTTVAKGKHRFALDRRIIRSINLTGIEVVLGV